MSNLLDDLIKSAGNELATVASKGIPTSDIAGFIDTGSMIFNALVSGDINGGLASNKITVLAGEEATGKTFFLLSTIQHFLETKKDGRVVLFESESAITKAMLEERGMDVSRIAVLPVATIQEFRTQAVKVLDHYIEKGKEVPLLMALDSLGMLSTDKEVEDIASGSDKRDMTRSQLIRGAFRVLTLKLGQANVPLFVTNHVYQVLNSYIPTSEMGGGCLVAGTRIFMGNGQLKNIEDVKIGDVVKTMTGRNTVTQTFNFHDKEIYEIEFEDGLKIKASAEHKFLVNDEWISTKKLFNLLDNKEEIQVRCIITDE